MAVDGSGDILKGNGVDSFPTTVLIGPDGKIRLYQVGPVLNADVAFAELLRVGLAEIADGQRPEIRAYVWQRGRYAEIRARAMDRRFGVGMGTYP